MRQLYEWKTKVGSFFICEHEGRFCPVFDDEPLGSYLRPDQAAEDLAGGHTFSVRGGIDPTKLGISSDLSDWTPLVSARDGG